MRRRLRSILKLALAVPANCRVECRRKELQDSERQTTRKGVVLRLPRGYGRRDYTEPTVPDIEHEAGRAARNVRGEKSSAARERFDPIVPGARFSTDANRHSVVVRERMIYSAGRSTLDYLSEH
jgi:hypothetical protein